MDQHLASMIARSEHKQRQTVYPPILDFDRRGHVSKPGWLERGLSTLHRLTIRLITRLKQRIWTRHQSTLRHEMPISENY